MKRSVYIHAAVLIFALSIPVLGSPPDINTILMRSTFKIAGSTSLGTAFIIGRPVTDDKQRAYYVLVTAAHVLRDIQGESAVLFLRQKKGDDFSKLPYSLLIRKGNQHLWTEHPTADVAVMYISLPEIADIQLLPMSSLASDQELEQFEIHPGDALSCLGYPYGAEANDAGFPILRSGQIASYPLTPTEKVRTFLFDFRVFGGNSGGPVYFVGTNRTYSGSTHVGQTIQFLVGLVSRERIVQEEIKSLTEVRQAKHQLSLAVVVPAPLIREAINLLPPKPEE